MQPGTTEEASNALQMLQSSMSRSADFPLVVLVRSVLRCLSSGRRTNRQWLFRRLKPQRHTRRVETERFSSSWRKPAWDLHPSVKSTKRLRAAPVEVARRRKRRIPHAQTFSVQRSVTRHEPWIHLEHIAAAGHSCWCWFGQNERWRWTRGSPFTRIKTEHVLATGGNHVRTGVPWSSDARDAPA